MRTNAAGIGVAVAAIALGGLVFAGSFAIPLGTGYDRIGPRFFPWLVAAGLLVSGVLLVPQELRARKPPAGALRASTLGTLAAALGSSVLLMERAGFLLTSALLFWLVARAFESRRPVRDLVVGIVLSAAAYLAFTRGLGLELPRGPIGIGDLF